MTSTQRWLAGVGGTLAAGFLLWKLVPAPRADVSVVEANIPDRLTCGDTLVAFVRVTNAGNADARECRVAFKLDVDNKTPGFDYTAFSPRFQLTPNETRTIALSYGSSPATVSYTIPTRTELECDNGSAPPVDHSTLLEERR